MRKGHITKSQVKRSGIELSNGQRFVQFKTNADAWCVARLFNLLAKKPITGRLVACKLERMKKDFYKQ